MTGTLLAFSLILLGADDQTPAVIAEGPDLTIDGCIAVDQETVRQVMELEISDVRPWPSVHVQCVDGAQEIRLGRSEALDPGNVRTINMTQASDGDTPAARQARSRELALAIAEFVRRPGPAARPPEAPPAPVSPIPPPVPALASASAPEHEAKAGRWQGGVLCAFEHFARGQILVGADLLGGLRLGSWFLAELRLGGRLGASQRLPGEYLTTRAAAGAAAVGVYRWSKSGALGGALVLRAQGYLFQFRSEGMGEGPVESAAFGAFALALEPRLMVAVTPRLQLQAAVAAGVVPHGIVVRIQGVETPSPSGVVMSANLAGVVAF